MTTRLSPGLVLALLAAACAGPAAGRGEKIVEGVEIRGNKSFKDKEITSKLATRPPKRNLLLFFLPKKKSTYDPLALRVDEKRVVAFYRERGYFDAEVADVDVRPVGDGGVAVDIQVEEGRPTRVSALDVSGLPPDVGIDPKRILAEEGVHEGDVLVHPQYIAARDRLEAELVVRGYAHADIEGSVLVDRDAHTAIIRLEADPGPKVRFGQVHVVGNERIPEEAIRARVSWSTGEVFDPKKIELTQGRLYQLGYFSAIRVDYEQTGRPEVADVTIRVSEGKRHELRLGGGIGLDRSYVEIRGRAGYVVRSWLHPLVTLTTDVRPGYAVFGETRAGGNFTGEATIGVEKDDFLVPRLRLSNEVAYKYDIREAYTTRGPRARVGLDRTFLLNRLAVGAGWQIHYLAIVGDDPTVAMALGAQDPYRLAFFEQSLSYDRRDAPLDARRGFYALVRLEEGGPYAGGTFNYLKMTPELRGYVPVGKRLTVASYVRVGGIRGLGGTPTPLTQRYFGGGSSGHRGFSYRRLSPQVLAEDGRRVPVGGDALLESSLETRLDLVKLRGQWLGMAVFVDAGDVTEGYDQLQLAELHYAAGAGLRYNTIVGPLRFDLGFRLNRLEAVGPDGRMNPDPGDRFAFHFSLGEAF